MPDRSVEPDDPHVIMRWVTLWVFLIALLISLIAGIFLAYWTSSPVPLTIPAPLLVSMRPIINYLFPRGRRK
jgi:ABC-type amino acid transport system permease subunit